MKNIDIFASAHRRGVDALSTPDWSFGDLRVLKLKHFGFTLAEMMVVMLILSIVMAAMAPVMTTRNKLDQSSPWQWAGNGSDAYYGLGDAQVAMIGQQEAQNEDSGARLVINTGDGKDHILFKSGENVQGRLKFENSGLLLGSLASGNLGSNAIAFGLNTRASNNNTTAVGVNSTATGSDSTSLGSSSVASGTQSSAIGYSAQASGNYSHAIGDEASAGAEGTIAIGSQSSSTIASGITIGMQASSTNTDAIAIGKLSEASGYKSTVLGADSIASGSDSTAIGNTAKATNSFASALGYASEATGLNSTALGYSGKATGNYSTALGASSLASGSYSTAFGMNSEASGNISVALGYNSKASGLNSVALGYNSEATELYSTALGYYAWASNDSATAVGHFTRALGENSVALGHNSIASGKNSVAIGGAETMGENNIGIGVDACANATGGSNVICIGKNSGPSFGSSLSVRGKSDMLYLGNSSTTVYIPGNIVVEGHVLLGLDKESYVYLRTAHKGSTSSQSTKSVVALARSEDWHGDDDNFAKSYPTGLSASGNRFFGDYVDEMKTKSDRRLKYVGQESTSGLDKIRELKVFNYTFKKDEKKTPHVGVIAQDLQKVFPDAVKKGVDGFLTIRFEDMFFAMINAIKELDSKYQAQEARINELEARIEKLEAKIK